MTRNTLCVFFLAFFFSLPAQAGMKKIDYEFIRSFHVVTVGGTNAYHKKAPVRSLRNHDKVANSVAPGRSTKAIEVARKYKGGKPSWIKRSRLWCADFINGIEKKLGRSGTNSSMARSFLSHPNYKHISNPTAGDIAVTKRGKSKSAGHVLYITGFKKHLVCGISGNSRGGKVAEGCYQTSKVLGYVRPL